MSYIGCLNLETLVGTQSPFAGVPVELFKTLEFMPSWPFHGAYLAVQQLL